MTVSQEWDSKILKKGRLRGLVFSITTPASLHVVVGENTKPHPSFLPIKKPGSKDLPGLRLGLQILI
jgi:hypothetical protein